MATQEKVDVVIVGAGASGSVYAAVLAKAGKKVVLLESGPDWQSSDLISSDFWGRRLKPAGAPFLLEGKNPYGYAYQAGWGVGYTYPNDRRPWMRIDRMLGSGGVRFSGFSVGDSKASDHLCVVADVEW